MRLLLFVLAAISLAVAEDSPLSPVSRFYHSSVGIAGAQRIRQYEQAVDFDGGRISGGQSVAAGAQPHLGGLVIDLTNGRESVCGSSLLSNTRSVTAAHCWWDGRNQARRFTIVWGSNKLFSGGTRVATNNVVMHEGWNPFILANDVAIINHNSVAYSNVIKRIAIATGSNSYVGQWATAAGFGVTSDTDSITYNQDKRQINLQVVTNDVCRRAFGNVVTDSILCTSGVGGSTCGGDSGGPLAIGSGNNRILIGITNYGSPVSCTLVYPLAFARVTSFASWLQARI